MTMDRQTIKNRIYDALAPMVLYPGGGEHNPNHTPLIIQRRVIDGIANPKRIKATDLEVFLYLMSATLCFPPDHDAFKAIAYLCRKEMPDVAKAGDMPEVQIDQEYSVKNLIDRLGRDIYKSQLKQLEPVMRMLTGKNHI